MPTSSSGIPTPRPTLPTIKEVTTQTSLFAPSSEETSAKQIGIEDVQRSFKLFYDSGRSVKFVAEFEKRLIGDAGDVNLFYPNGSGGDAMEIS